MGLFRITLARMDKDRDFLRASEKPKISQRDFQGTTHHGRERTNYGPSPDFLLGVCG